MLNLENLQTYLQIINNLLIFFFFYKTTRKFFPLLSAKVFFQA